MIQLSTPNRNARLDTIETTTGTAPNLRLRTGAPPANCAAARTGTIVASMALPSDWMAAASGGTKAKSGTWQDASADATGVVAHYEIMDTANTNCHEQGRAGQNVVLTTNALTAANGNVLNFAATTGVVVGMKIAGTGVHAEATVVATTGTTVTMSHTSTAGVANAASITFSEDMELDNASINAGQVVTVTTYSRTDGNA